MPNRGKLPRWVPLAVWLMATAVVWFAYWRTKNELWVCIYVGVIFLLNWLESKVSPRQPEQHRFELLKPVPGLSGDPSTWPTGECDLVLSSSGVKPIRVIKALRQVYSLDLRDAHDMVVNAPQVLKQGISFAEAEFVKPMLEAVGAQVDIRKHA